MDRAGSPLVEAHQNAHLAIDFVLLPLRNIATNYRYRYRLNNASGGSSWADLFSSRNSARYPEKSNNRVGDHSDVPSFRGQYVENRAAELFPRGASLLVRHSFHPVEVVQALDQTSD